MGITRQLVPRVSLGRSALRCTHGYIARPRQGRRKRLGFGIIGCRGQGLTYVKFVLGSERRRIVIEAEVVVVSVKRDDRAWN